MLIKPALILYRSGAIKIDKHENKYDQKRFSIIELGSYGYDGMVSQANDPVLFGINSIKRDFYFLGETRDYKIFEEV
jgi:hypothetical protein